MQLPEKKYIASFDIDAQNTFTPVCPDEPRFSRRAQPLRALDQRR